MACRGVAERRQGIVVLRQMPDVLCPWCVQQGGLKIITKFQARPAQSSIKGRIRFAATEVPVLACELCGQEAAGNWDGPGHVIFPDPHV